MQDDSTQDEGRARAALTGRIAYLLYEHRGRRPGRARDDWFLAEALIGLCEQGLLALGDADAGSGPAVETGDASAPATEATEAATSSPAAEIRCALRAWLERSVAADGRKQTAERLGYASSSSVGRLLRGDGPITGAPADRIREAMPTATPSSATEDRQRRAA